MQLTEVSDAINAIMGMGTRGYAWRLIGGEGGLRSTAYSRSELLYIGLGTDPAYGDGAWYAADNLTAVCIYAGLSRPCPWPQSKCKHGSQEKGHVITGWLPRH